jgi:hypothetical protein
MSFEYINEQWFNQMGDALIMMGHKLKVLHVLSNGKVDGSCVPYAHVASISSEDYHNFKKPSLEFKF